jgi:hypothetical protein
MPWLGIRFAVNGSPAPGPGVLAVVSVQPAPGSVNNFDDPRVAVNCHRIVTKMKLGLGFVTEPSRPPVARRGKGRVVSRESISL